MIPKKLHYVWWGKPLSQIEQQWMDNSIKNNPDYEHKIWSNEDVPSCNFLEVALKEEKYAYAADYIRMWVLYNKGGFYVDTDMELIKPLPSDYLKCSLVLPQETVFELGGHFIGSSKKNRMIRQILNLYLQFDGETIDTEKWVIPNILNKYVPKYYGNYATINPYNGKFLSLLPKVKLLEENIGTPYYPWDKERTGNLVYTVNSIGIHYWNTFKKENDLELESFDGKD